jgi:uncharacterized membrane protein
MNFREFVKQPLPMFLIFWGALSGLFYLVVWYGTDRSDIFLDSTYVVFDGAIIFMALTFIFVYKFYGMKSFEGKVWLIMSIGGFLWMFGELASASKVVAGYLDVQSGALDYLQSNLDNVIIVGYLFFIAAFVYKAMYSKLYFDAKKIGMVVAVTLAFAIPSVLFVCLPVIGSDEITDYEKFVDVAYVSLDIVLLGLGAFIAIYWGREVSKGWYLIALGIVSMTIADSMIAGLDWQGIYYDGNFFELLFIGSYLLFALGALYQKKIHESFI